MTVLVFANGVIDDPRWITPRLEGATAVIAADGGLRHLRALGVWPDVFIGDLDSLPRSAADELAAAGVTTIDYPHDKDETDLELALLYAGANYSDAIEVYGAAGGRLDHALANITLLAHPRLAQREIRLVDENTELWLVTSRTEIHGRVGDTVSLIPLRGDVLVEATTGLRWPLTNEILTFGQARGVSNELVSPVATVVVGPGQLLCLHLRTADGDRAGT